jgi:mannosylglycerate hydrolase
VCSSDLHLTASQDGFSLNDKLSGLSYPNIITIENRGDDGDSYDYSPPEHDQIYDHRQANLEEVELILGSTVQILRATISYQLPANAYERSQNIQTVKTRFKLTFSLLQGDYGLGLQVESCNTISDSRFRLVFNPHIITDTVLSDGFLSSQSRPVENTMELSVWQNENWVEKPVSIENYRSYVALHNKSGRAALFSRGTNEYEVINGAIYITLWRSFGHLGKRGLNNRPGRASGIEIATPDNQLLGQKFHFQFRLTLGDLPHHEATESSLFLSPLLAYQLKNYNRFNLNKPKVSQSIETKLNLNLKGAVVSALKFSPYNQLFVRLFNPIHQTIELEHNKLHLANVFEQPLEKIEAVVLKPQQIVNIIIAK